MIPKLYTPKEAGELIGVSEDTIRKLVKSGDLAATNIGTGTINPVMRISEQALTDFIESRTNEAKTNVG